MRMRVLLLAAVAAMAAAYLLRDVGGSGVSDRPAPPARVATPGPIEVAPTSDPAPLRNVFEYSDAVPVEGPVPAFEAPAVPPVETAPPPATAAPAPLVRLVGLVRGGGQVRAALVIAGETVVLAPGESADGFAVVSIDEDEGVRVRMPDGSTLALGSGRD